MPCSRLSWAELLARGMAGCLLLSLVSACSFLPQGGPTTVAVVSEENNGSDVGGYILIDLNERVASICAAQPRPTFRSLERAKPAPDLRIGVGDSVSVTIWEAAAGGLFSAAPSDRTVTAGSRTSTLPDQVVPQDGTIQVPYAGRIRVAGLRPADVEQLVVQRLQGKAIEPQAVVTISRNTSNTATVTGEVTAGARIPLSVRGDRLLDVVASAGGIRVPAHESMVKLTRGRNTVTVPLNSILSDPKENVFVLPDDVITVVRVPLTFTAFGNTGNNALVSFDTAGVTLDEAMAKAGGVLDSRADPTGVFLMRFESADIVRAILPERKLPSNGNVIPVIYRLDVRTANSFFLARAFEVKPKDILYVSNAPSIPLEKFLALIGTVTGPVITGIYATHFSR